MRSFLFFLTLIFFGLATTFGQAPNAFNYQAVIRNSSGELVQSQEIAFRFSILQGTTNGPSVYSETQLATSNNYGVCNLKIGDGNNVTGDINLIEWPTDTYYLKVETDITGGTEYVHIGTSELVSVPYALHSNTAASANIANSLNNDVFYFTNSDTLFAIKDRTGKIVFAVFNDGVKVYVNEGAKGNVGGFAVSGRGTGKATEYSVLNITPDSARFYLNNTTKGTPGGFAVSGRGTGKDVINDYLQITPDSTRIYINDNTKGQPGGFAVSGRGTGKTNSVDYFNVSGAESSNMDSINPSRAGMLWYPKSEAFLVGRVLVEHPDSVGINSLATGYESKAIGDYSQALGYKSIARSNYSTAIGKNALANGLNSFAFGDEAQAISDYAFAIGSGARAVGAQSFALGSITQDTTGAFSEPPYALGDYSMAIGLGTKSEGLASVSLGANNRAIGNFSTALGHNSTASGNRSITLGPYSTSAGYASTTVGYRNETTPEASFALAGGVGSKAYESGAIAFGAYCHAYGARSVAMGDACTTDGFGSVAMGKGSDALATGAIALGLGNIADGVRSVALGAAAYTNGMEGAFVFNGGVEKSVAHATRAGQVVFLGSGGLNFYANKDTAEVNSFVITPGSGNVGVGTFNPTEKMEISGGSLLMTDGDIKLNGGEIILGIGKNTKIADYVFTDDFKLESIEEHAEFMWREKHLPALKSKQEIMNEGVINIAERREQIVEELEKAHIYINQLHERIKVLEEQNEVLKQNMELRKRIEDLEKILLE